VAEEHHMTAPTSIGPTPEGVLRDDIPTQETEVHAVDGPHWWEDHVGDSTDLPRGRKGLWGALTLGSSPTVEGLLPVVDASALGRSGGSMFDVDPSASIDLTRV